MSKVKQPLSISLLLFTLFSGCSSSTGAWVIQEQASKGKQGKIGYRDLSNETKQEVLGLIPCKNFEIVAEENREKVTRNVGHQYVSSTPITGGYGGSLYDNTQLTGGSVGHSRAPIYDDKKETWWELTYKCP